MPLTSNRPKANYNCTQEELYQICFLIWDSYLENVTDFTAENTTYTTLFGQTNRAAALAAKQMPDFQQRDEASETLLILIRDAADQCLIKWQSLEGYIKKSFPEKLHKPKLEAAGSSHYEKAAEHNWESLSALMQSGKQFIDDNTATLTTGGMPAGFPGTTGTFNTARTSFENLFTQLKDAQQDAEEARDNKINANNAIFSAITSLNQDAQKIYRLNAAKRERFTFTKVLELVSGAGATTKTITIPPASSENVQKVRANSPITNIAQIPIIVSATSPDPTLKPAPITLNPDDTIPNTFGPNITLTNQDPAISAQCTVRISQT